MPLWEHIRGHTKLPRGPLCPPLMGMENGCFRYWGYKYGYVGGYEDLQGFIRAYGGLERVIGAYRNDSGQLLMIYA